MITDEEKRKLLVEFLISLINNSPNVLEKYKILLFNIPELNQELNCLNINPVEDRASFIGFLASDFSELVFPYKEEENYVQLTLFEFNHDRVKDLFSEDIYSSDQTQLLVHHK